MGAVRCRHSQALGVGLITQPHLIRSPGSGRASDGIDVIENGPPRRAAAVIRTAIIIRQAELGIEKGHPEGQQ
jgi:hypothetical protein